MSEYIISDEQLGLIRDFATVCVEGEKLPRIVRCRDCKFYQPKEGAMLSCRFEYQGFTQWKLAEPDGFCAWGERKNDE